MSRSLLILVAVALVMSAITGLLAGAKIFSVWGAGFVLGGAIAMLAPAILAALIAAGIYWLGRRRLMPHLFTVIWTLWSLFAMLNLIQVLRINP